MLMLKRIQSTIARAVASTSHVFGTRACIEGLEDRRLFAAVTFTLKPNPSVATLSSAGSIGLTPQAKESLSACYTGSIKAHVGAHTLQFATNDKIVGMGEYTGNVQPNNTTADFSAVAGGLLDVALRNLVFGIKSPAITLNSDGTFSNTGETIYVEAGKIDYAGVNGLSLTGTKTLVGLSAKNNTAKPGHYTVSNGVATLTIPFKATVTFAFSSSLQGRFTFNGKLVASATVAKS